MLSTLISAIATLAAAFAGAYAAFMLNERKSDRAAVEENIRGANRLLFSLFQQANMLLLYRRDFLDPIREQNGRHIALRPMMPGQFQRVRMPLELVQFLTTTKHVQTLFDLAVEQERFDTAITSIEVQSGLQIKEVQPRLAGIGVQHGDFVTGEQAEAALGNMLHKYLSETTNQVYFHVDETIKSLEVAKNKLRDSVLNIYPEADLIDFVPKKDTQRGAAADR